jgi:alpha-amylase
MKSLLIKILIALCITTVAHSATTEEWKSRTIYQLLTDRFYPDPPYYPPIPPTPHNVCRNWRHYCGGTYKGIVEKLPYIKSMGFDAIWISPIVRNVEMAGQTSGYHGYWMTALYELNEHFGTGDDLKALVKAAHAMDIFVMVDIVANHAGPIGQDYSQFSKELNQPEHYHEYCNVFDEDHPENQWRMERCWLAGLADFNHENPYVVEQLTKWISNMVTTYNLDGLRIDTIPHVPHHFWKKFSDASNVFQVGEALDPRADYVGSYQNYLHGKTAFKLILTLPRNAQLPIVVRNPSRVH